MNVENENKGMMAFAPVLGLAGLALVAVPFLPMFFGSNPDQA